MIVKKYRRGEVVRSILAYLKVNMTDDQRKELGEWLGSDERNQKLFERLQNVDYVEGGLREFQKYDSVEDWKKLQAKLQVSRRKIGHWMRVCVASVTILFCVGMAWYFVGSDMNNENVTSSVIEYGHSKAMLFLATGEVIELESTLDTVHTRIEGENFVNDGKRLVYSDTTRVKEVEWHTLQVPRGGEFVLCLADGTVVTLNADSKIHYPDRFTGDERQVSLEGEAFFEVAKDSLKPFVVKTNDIDVRVLGTAFNLKAYPDEHQQTTLVRGAVEVLLNKQQVILQPGEQATCIDQELRVERVDIRPYIAWKNERFVFENEPLEAVLKKLERWYNITVFIQNPSLKQLRFTGNLPKYENINNVLNILALTTNIKFELNDCTLVVQLE
ncbi:MAG TPA: DUF4974 domain-containing protein [Butyricimonas virosa]|uniref:DUF4974 domain-containing protein n=1 Tax=Butyricimonas virosa TaxID=544645 RepID=A0A921KXB1_9BACT|nr:DUF4974 domain-containing protein [Butyricimonas virosa]